MISMQNNALMLILQRFITGLFYVVKGSVDVLKIHIPFSGTCVCFFLRDVYFPISFVCVSPYFFITS